MFPASTVSSLFQIEPGTEGLRVRFSCSEFDDLHVRGITNELFGLASTQGELRLSLDMSSIDFLCSDMLGSLIVLDRKLQDRGGSLKLCNLKPAVYEVFTFTRLNDILDVSELQRT